MFFERSEKKNWKEVKINDEFLKNYFILCDG